MSADKQCKHRGSANDLMFERPLKQDTNNAICMKFESCSPVKKNVIYFFRSNFSRQKYFEKFGMISSEYRLQHTKNALGATIAAHTEMITSVISPYTPHEVYVAWDGEQRKREHYYDHQPNDSSTATKCLYFGYFSLLSTAHCCYAPWKT